jgi:hypothetical protein
MTWTIQSIAQWIGLILLVTNGTLLQTSYWKIIVACCVMVVVSLLLKIIHSPLGHELFVASSIVIVLVYTVRFLQKKQKNLLDWLKYFWICSWLLSGAATNMGFPFEAIDIIGMILFWVTVFVFISVRLKSIGENKN